MLGNKLFKMSIFGNGIVKQLVIIPLTDGYAGPE